jgi:flagellum-specific peptidoglycan hydrolase FlgJ
MKTKFTLIASLIILSALITVVVPANGQRRSSNSEVVKSRSEQKENNNNVKKNEPAVNEDSKARIPNNNSKGRKTSTRKNESDAAAKTNSPAVKKRSNSANQERKVYQQPAPQRNDRPAAVQRRIPETNRSSIKNNPAQMKEKAFVRTVHHGKVHLRVEL